MLYLHGGGFCIGSPATQALATHLAAATGATVHVLDYRLAPEHPSPPPSTTPSPRGGSWRPTG